MDRNRIASPDHADHLHPACEPAPLLSKTRIVSAHNIEIVLIALPSATGLEMTRIFDCCSVAGVADKTVPGLGKWHLSDEPDHAERWLATNAVESSHS
jgi:hypothetical protein